MSDVPQQLSSVGETVINQTCFLPSRHVHPGRAVGTIKQRPDGMKSVCSGTMYEALGPDFLGNGYPEEVCWLRCVPDKGSSGRNSCRGRSVFEVR